MTKLRQMIFGNTRQVNEGTEQQQISIPEVFRHQSGQYNYKLVLINIVNAMASTQSLWKDFLRTLSVDACLQVIPSWECICFFSRVTSADITVDPIHTTSSLGFQVNDWQRTINFSPRIELSGKNYRAFIIISDDNTEPHKIKERRKNIWN